MINQYSQKRRDRIATYSEAQFFKDIWRTRPHKSELSGVRIKEASTYCFVHILSKKMYPQYRYYPNNICLVASMAEHARLDAIVKGNHYEIEQEIMKGNFIDIKAYELRYMYRLG